MEGSGSEKRLLGSKKLYGRCFFVDAVCGKLGKERKAAGKECVLEWEGMKTALKSNEK